MRTVDPRAFALTVLCAAALGASAARADAPTPTPTPTTEAPVKRGVVVLDLEAASVEPGQAALVTGLVVDALAKYDELAVLQRSDIAQIAAFEADKQALGCSETSCLAEIAGALGAAYVVFGRVGTLDNLVLVQLNLFDAAAGKPIARQDIRARRLGDVAAWMPSAVGKLVQPLTGIAPPADPVLVDEDDPGLLVQGMRWGGLGTAGAALVAGGAATAVAGVAAVVILDDTADAKDRNAMKGLGAGMVVTTAVAGAIAAVGAAAFGLSYLGGA